MSEFYEDLQQTAYELLVEFGQDVVLRSYTPGGGGGYNPSAGRATANSQPKFKDSTRKGVVVDAPLNRVGPQYGQKMEEGTLIPQNNKWMYMDASGPAPRLQDHVIIAGIEYGIDNIQTMNPAGTPLLYTLVLVA